MGSFPNYDKNKFILQDKPKYQILYERELRVSTILTLKWESYFIHRRTIPTPFACHPWTLGGAQLYLETNLMIPGARPLGCYQPKKLGSPTRE